MSPTRHRPAQGFTFLEIMLVVLIIGILVGIVVPRFIGRSEQARRNASRLAISSVETSLQEFEYNYSRFPEDLDELLNPPVPPGGGDPPEFLDRPPLDGWGNPLLYNFPAEHGGRHYDLYSPGANGQDDRGQGDDIVPWAREDEQQI